MNTNDEHALRETIVSGYILHKILGGKMSRMAFYALGIKEARRLSCGGASVDFWVFDRRLQETARALGNS